AEQAVHETEPEASAAPDEPTMRLDITPAPDLGHDDDDPREPAPVVALFGDGERGRGDKPKTSVDELFARLRASRTENVARRVSADA
ncbi:hypothetical protein, partial [Brucella melitensis]|uniref:hypothetical protein n=1 Tax=Brucella melitensis TaxID=29459 RepID=UPI003B67E52A